MEPLNDNFDDDAMAFRLKREASMTWPAFSPLLHARIMRKITAISASTPQIIPNRRFIAPLAAAAAILLAVGLFATLHWRPRPLAANAPQRQDSSAIAQLPTLPSIDFFASVAEPTGQRVLEARFAYLDRDAQRLTRYLANQLDVLPSAP